jgi:hypothetical protein
MPSVHQHTLVGVVPCWASRGAPRKIPGGVRGIGRLAAGYALTWSEEGRGFMPQVISHTGSTGLTAVAFQQVTVSTTAVALSIAEDVIPKRVWLTVHTNAIRYRFDADPTATEGHKLGTNGTLEIIGATAIERFRMIRDAAADAEVAYTVEV